MTISYRRRGRGLSRGRGVVAEMRRPMSRCLWLAVAVVALAFASAVAQTPSVRDVKLVGDRFKPLTYAEMSPEQRSMIEHVLMGERASTGGPFNVLLRSPQMG